MKYTISINQPQALALGITNINQAVIFDLLTGLSTWAKPVIIDNEIYYWVSRQRISTELALLNLKPDTIYRHLKSLADLRLIDYKKDGKKDCVRITDLGKTYYVGNGSEFTAGTMSEIDPSPYVGNKSEKNSDLNPTDPNTRIKEDPLFNLADDRSSTDLTVVELLDRNGQPIEVSFDDFWNLYDKKTKKQEALRFWNKLTFADRMTAHHQAASYVLTITDKKYQMDPSTFLNPANRRWEDDFNARRQTNGTNQQTYPTTFAGRENKAHDIAAHAQRRREQLVQKVVGADGNTGRAGIHAAGGHLPARLESSVYERDDLRPEHFQLGASAQQTY